MEVKGAARSLEVDDQKSIPRDSRVSLSLSGPPPNNYVSQSAYSHSSIVQQSNHVYRLGQCPPTCSSSRDCTRREDRLILQTRRIHLSRIIIHGWE